MSAAALVAAAGTARLHAPQPHAHPHTHGHYYPPPAPHGAVHAAPQQQHAHPHPTAAAPAASGSVQVTARPIAAGDVIEERRAPANGGPVGLIGRYSVGEFLGKGGFASVHLMTAQPFDAKLLPADAHGRLPSDAVLPGRVLAGKIIPKTSLAKESARKKLVNEIKIHRSLNHPNIVRFERHFEDKQNVYILLEVCKSQTMMELVKRRVRLTEAEAQYYFWQLIDTVAYLHSQKVIHRDLKLGNLFLDAHLNIKLGDFGLATKLEYDEERKKTICGTPNYIAPEILSGPNGHSYEVDIWSMGVILYTWLIGKPPFESTSVKSTYKRIRDLHYSFPETVRISHAATALITRILDAKPENRPSLQEMRAHAFFSQSPVPKSLPYSVLTVPLEWPHRCYPGSNTVTAAANLAARGAIAVATAPPLPLPLPLPLQSSSAHNSNNGNSNGNANSGTGNGNGNALKPSSLYHPNVAGAAVVAADQHAKQQKADAAKVVASSLAPGRLSGGSRHSGEGLADPARRRGSSQAPAVATTHAAAVADKENAGANAQAQVPLRKSSRTATATLAVPTAALPSNSGLPAAPKHSLAAAPAPVVPAPVVVRSTRSRAATASAAPVAAAPAPAPAPAPTSARGTAPAPAPAAAPTRAAAAVPAPATRTSTRATTATAPAAATSKPAALSVAATVPIPAPSATASATAAMKPLPPIRTRTTTPSEGVAAGAAAAVSAAANAAAALEQALTGLRIKEEPKAAAAPAPLLRTGSDNDLGSTAAAADAAITPTAAAASAVPSSASVMAATLKGGDAAMGVGLPAEDIAHLQEIRRNMRRRAERERAEAASAAAAAAAGSSTAASTAATATAAASASASPKSSRSARSASVAPTAAAAAPAASSASSSDAHAKAVSDLEAEEAALRRVHDRIEQSFCLPAGASVAGGAAAAVKPSSKSKAAAITASSSSSSSSSSGSSSGTTLLPHLEPDVYVKTWVDHSGKYGTAYLLSNGNAGVYFNDATKAILHADQSTFEYVGSPTAPAPVPSLNGGATNGIPVTAPDGIARTRYTLRSYPKELHKKVTLLKHFVSYLHRPKPTTASGAAAAAAATAAPAVATLPAPSPFGPDDNGLVFVKKWVHTRHAVLFLLSNGTVQTLFYDHTELVLWRAEQCVTFTNRLKQRATYAMIPGAAHTFPDRDIPKRLKYMKDILSHLVGAAPAAAAPAPAASTAPAPAASTRSTRQ